MLKHFHLNVDKECRKVFMTEKYFGYFQFREELGYPIFLRFEDENLEGELLETLELLGFNKVDRDAVKSIPFQAKKTKILKVGMANARLVKKIQAASLDIRLNENESYSEMGLYDLYSYKSQSLMVVGEQNPLWELSLVSTKNQFAVRGTLIRFLSLALAAHGVVGFWGVPVDEGIVIMNSANSNHEVVFIDMKISKIISFEGVKELQGDFQILRLSSTLRNEMKKMERESLYSFLSVNTTFFGSKEYLFALNKACFELSNMAIGVIYPKANFKPRLETSKAA